MDSELLKILSEEIRETRNLTIETRKQVEETKRLADKAEKQADAAMKKADAAWELVVMTRNQIKEELAYMRLPWWKKLVGSTS
jgi:predicted  nucleic acid-binding Zn-ribbon protein